MTRSAVTALISLGVLAGCGQPSGGDSSMNTSGPIAAVSAPAGTEWSSTVVATPEGGMLMGNPAAAVKLVEYASLTCPHCGEFSLKAAEALKSKYVASGKLSWELRNYVRDPVDVTATLLARCGGPGPFFPLVEQMYLDQANWFAKVQAMSQADYAAIGALQPAEQFKKFAALTGLGDFVRQRGVSADRMNACLSDTGAVDKLLETQKKATEQYAIPGTPTFLINGQVVPETATWDVLEPKLKAAGA